MEKDYLNKGIVTDLLSQYDFQEILPYFLKLWEENEKKQCSPKAIALWGRLFNALKKEEHLPTKLHLKITSRWEHTNPVIDMNCCVWDTEGNLLGPLAWHPKIKEILSMKIYVNKDINIADDELAAGLFWEISYFKTEEKIELIQRMV